MAGNEKTVQTVRCFYNALQLPVTVRSGENCLFSSTAVIETAASVTGNPALQPVPDDDTAAVQYILSEAGERFIFASPSPGVTVMVGPFLTERTTEEDITRLIRAGKVKMRERNAMREYFAGLKTISMEQYYYTGKLLEMLLDAGRTEEAPPSEESPGQFIPSEFYLHTQDYRARQFIHSPYMTEQEICHYISTGDGQSALRILKEINERPRAQLAGTALRSLKNSLIASCTFMARAAISGGVRPDDAFTLSDAYIRQIEACNDIRLTLRMEEEMVSGFTAAVNSMKLGRYSEAVRGALVYIENHLCEKLSLSQIAEAVYLNPNYLSGLFSAETGETVHNYIIRRRVEDAGYFMKNSTEPIADIASFYQFSSQSHFVQCFRRIMGVTPGVYRKSGTEA